MVKKENFFETKKVVASFAIVSLISGIFFINYKITGNVILNKYSFNIISLIGVLLILCSIILIIYSTRKN